MLHIFVVIMLFVLHLKGIYKHVSVLEIVTIILEQISKYVIIYCVNL